MTITGPNLNASSTSRDDDSAREAERVARVSDQKRAQFLSALRNSDASKARPGRPGSRPSAGNQQAVWDRLPGRPPESCKRSTAGPAGRDADSTTEPDQADGTAREGLQNESPGTPGRTTPGKPASSQGFRGETRMPSEQSRGEAAVGQDAPTEESSNGTQPQSAPQPTPTRRGSPGAADPGGRRPIAPKSAKGESPVSAGRSPAKGAELGLNVDVSQAAAAEAHAREERGDTKSDSVGDEGSSVEDTEGQSIHGLVGFTGSATKMPAPVPQAIAGRLPSAVLQQVIEFANVHHNTRGEAEFLLGLVAGAAGGLRLKITALGKRRFGLRVSCCDKRTINDLEAQIAALIEKLGDRDLEVVDVEIEPAG